MISNKHLYLLVYGLFYATKSLQLGFEVLFVKGKTSPALPFVNKGVVLRQMSKISFVGFSPVLHYPGVLLVRDRSTLDGL